ncbi:DUF6883 domain-containing protein [Haloferula sp. A504]|uniref:DUF6883 domain-containing protein n=1 Tax=Haloferula sp. A504 TaxID=3373601 RepID=UPI0037B4C8CD
MPDFTQAEIPEPKLIDYLFKLDHPEGGSKARFFLGRGFRRDDLETFASALREQARGGSKVEITAGRFGTKISMDSSLSCPDGTEARIRTVWIVAEGSSIPRLVTAHPLG